MSGSGSVVVDGSGLPEKITVEQIGTDISVSGHVLLDLTMETHLIRSRGSLPDDQRRRGAVTRSRSPARSTSA